MDYSFLVTVAQIAGLALMGCGAVALLRLIVVHYVQHDWSEDQVRALQVITVAKAVGLLLLAFAAGGHLATHLFQTNQFPALPLLSVQAVLMAVLAASVIFLHVVAAPWLKDVERNDMAARPLVLDLTAHRSLALTLALAAFSSAWTLWVVLAVTAVAPQPSATFAALALMTLVFWALLGLPAIVFRALALHATRAEDPDAVGPVRVTPVIPDVPQHRFAHVPAPRAPRPRLHRESDDFNG